MRVLVTGATGCVGAHLVRALLTRGIQVRALVRTTSDRSALKGLELEYVEGDIRDLGPVRAAVDGCEHVYHVAARLGGWEKHRQALWATNVGGTENVIDACLKAGVKRLIFTSSSAAVGYSRDPNDVLDELTPWPVGGLGQVYPDSKRAAEDAVLLAAEKGLPAVVCNPTLVFGAWDRLFHSAQLLRMARSGGLLAYPLGGIGVVWAGDVAEGHLLAATSGQLGQRYILNGENLRWKALFRMIRAVVGGPPTALVPLPERFLKTASLATEAIALLRGSEPTLTRSRATGLSTFQYASDRRARKELGYHPNGAGKGIRETALWLDSHGLW